jgi:hypothetical protein
MSRLICSAFFILFFALPAQAQMVNVKELGAEFSPSRAIGTVVKVKGDAVANGSTNGMRMLEGGEEIISDDILVTFHDSRLEVKLNDGTSFVMGQLGRFIVEDFNYAPGKSGNKAAFNFLQGVFKMAAGGIASEDKAAFTVKTPVATIGIRGTEFWGGEIDGDFSVLVLKGKVVVENAAGSVEVPEGQGISIPKNAAPQAPSAWPDEKRTRAFATVSFE